MVKGDRVVYQHFHPDEQTFIEKCLDLIEQVEATYTFQVTEFLNPRQVAILLSLVNQTGLSCYASSDYYETEYARVLISPDYYVLNLEDFEISLLEFSYNTKFNHLTHRQILGTLINQLGIKRSIFGDILIAEGKVQILVETNMASYFSQNIGKIGKISVSLKEKNLNFLLPRMVHKQEKDILVTSWRADVIISEILNLSRSNAVKLIEKDNVKLNYASLGKVSQDLEVGDLLSIRGYGRYEIARENGLSKSGKIKLTIEKITE
ncbi:YlmH family RNA-binding protein [Streptococcus sp. S784/96/1]|uniref:YlmH family RNA-binding protein n=1 Tax=Streptococcus sp. S784/96/1 TaxID=2653499 RepID=UPI0013869770|nr:RNA-binding protein [Streptococcus sp. S784/96/1]